MLVASRAARAKASPASSTRPRRSSRWARTACTRAVRRRPGSSANVSTAASATAGPATSATATAWLSATTGPGRDRLEHLVEDVDLGPVGRVGRLGLGVDRGDRGLELEGTDRSLGQGGLDEGHALGDEAAVPERSVLLGQWHQIAVGGGAGGPPGIGQEHQGEQPGDLAVAGDERVEPAGQADRLGGERRLGEARPGGRGVAFGEDQVEHLGDDGEALGQLARCAAARRAPRCPGAGPWPG